MSRSLNSDVTATGDPRSGTHAVARSASGEARALRVLLVEDSDDDAALIVHELTRGGYTPSICRVESRVAFQAALDDGPWDVIVSDYSLPQYDGMAALADLQASGHDVPFLLVSGTIGEAVAVSAMRAGAQDYVLKADLRRLPVAVDRELREKVVRNEQARMREQLVISERMASAGMLAAGVAHEINNPLAVAVSNLEFVIELVSDLARGEPSAERARRFAEFVDPARDAREALDRIRDIVRDVKLFSRPEDETTGPVDVHAVIESAARMAWNEIRHRALLVKDFAPVPPVTANESRLGQVVLNLLVNAAQAMPDGHADRNELRIATRLGDDGRVVVEVSDTGIGIAPHDIDRIFDPFFTTKAVGEGTGLGLSICQRIVTQLGGTIAVESEVGKGTVFRVAFPPAREPRAVDEVVPVAAAARRARILVVDDEAALARALARTLEDDHDVVAVTTGNEALARLTAGERFDVILSDLMMPEMTGMELHARLREVAPDQADRVIFLTGGAFTATARDFLDTVPARWIEKPFRPQELLDMIARALDGRVALPPRA